MFRIMSSVVVAFGFATSASAVEVVFDNFDNGTLISNQYEDFLVSLEGTDDDASILSNSFPSGELIYSYLTNNPVESSTGSPLLIDFYDPVDDLMLTYRSVNGPGTLQFTTDSFFETIYLDYGQDDCRITTCFYDLSAYGPIYDLRMAFNNTFKDGSVNFEGDAFGLISMSYSLGSTGGPADPGPNVVPLPASGFLLLGALGAAGPASRRRRS